MKEWSADLGKKGSKVEITVKTTTSARTVNTSSLPAKKKNPKHDECKNTNNWKYNKTQHIIFPPPL